MKKSILVCDLCGWDTYTWANPPASLGYVEVWGQGNEKKATMDLCSRCLDKVMQVLRKEEP